MAPRSGLSCGCRGAGAALSATGCPSPSVVSVRGEGAKDAGLSPSKEGDGFDGLVSVSLAGVSVSAFASGGTVVTIGTGERGSGTRAARLVGFAGREATGSPPCASSLRAGMDRRRESDRSLFGVTAASAAPSVSVREVLRLNVATSLSSKAKAEGSPFSSSGALTDTGSPEACASLSDSSSTATPASPSVGAVFSFATFGAGSVGSTSVPASGS